MCCGMIGFRVEELLDFVLRNDWISNWGMIGFRIGEWLDFELGSYLGVTLVP